MKNMAIITAVLLLCCAGADIFAAAPTGTDAPGASSSAASAVSDELAEQLGDTWYVHSLMQDQVAKQLATDWIRAGRNQAVSVGDIARYFGGEGVIVTHAIAVKIRNILLHVSPPKAILMPDEMVYDGDYGSFKRALLNHLHGALTKAGAHHGISLLLSSMNLGELVRDNPYQFVDLLNAINNSMTDHSHQCMLTQLSLSNNGLTKLPASTFAQLGDLDTLHMGSNRLTALPSCIFAGLTHLQSLWLGANRLAIVPPRLFAGLANLQKLSLIGNQLTTLSPRTFAGLVNLRSLLLGANRLATLPPGIFAGLAHLTSLGLEGNQLPPETQEAIRQELPTTTVIKF